MQNTSDASTINYYNTQAKFYFDTTVNADMSECYERFIKYLKPGDSIIDVGAGSGRDIKYFLKCGFIVEGIDASSELCKLASEYTGINIQCQIIQKWNPKRKYDGIWANAFLLHLNKEEIQWFISTLPSLLKQDGVAYMSFKSGIGNGIDASGRYFTNITEKEIYEFVDKTIAISVADIWKTEDKLSREGFYWTNVIVKRTV